MGTKEKDKQEAILRLREMIKPGDTLRTVLRHVSRSGMSRHISVLRAGCHDITYLAGMVLNYRLADDGGLVVGGCGMDIGFSVVYALSVHLFPAGFECVGDRCPSNDHVNGDRNHKPHLHKEGGYALRHLWI